MIVLFVLFALSRSTPFCHDIDPVGHSQVFLTSHGNQAHKPPLFFPFFCCVYSFCFFHLASSARLPTFFLNTLLLLLSMSFATPLLCFPIVYFTDPLLLAPPALTLLAMAPSPITLPFVCLSPYAPAWLLLPIICQCQRFFLTLHPCSSIPLLPFFPCQFVLPPDILYGSLR